MNATIDIQYLEALLAEMGLRHDGIRHDGDFEYLFETRVRDLSRDVVLDRLNRLGFHDVMCAKMTIGGVFSVRFRVVPKRRAA
jgi:hypothetical protein